MEQPGIILTIAGIAITLLLGIPALVIGVKQYRKSEVSERIRSDFYETLTDYYNELINGCGHTRFGAITNSAIQIRDHINSESRKLKPHVSEESWSLIQRNLKRFNDYVQNEYGHMENSIFSVVTSMVRPMDAGLDHEDRLRAVNLDNTERANTLASGVKRIRDSIYQETKWWNVRNWF